MTYESFAPGRAASRCDVGDFILTHHGKFAGAAIRWGQALRFHGAQRKYAYWNHAALVVSAEGDLVEALVRTGATRSHLDKYKSVEYTLVRTKAAPLDQAQIVYFADRIVGEPYGFLQDLSVFVNYATGNKLSFGHNGTIMCSALVASAQLRAGAYFDRDAPSIAPADLALAYQVEKP